MEKLTFGKKAKIENRYIKPETTNFIPSKNVVFDNALKLAKSINPKKNERTYCIVSGDFVFGDFIEAFIDLYNFDIKELTISTLSMSSNNIDSLVNLLHKWKYVEKLNLIISRYFYGHEIKGLIKEIYEKLDHENKFQLAICDSHTKIAQFETKQGGKCVIYGSANLRSSQNIEQFTIEENSKIYDFNQSYFDVILEKYKTINKPIGYKDLIKFISETVNDKEEINENF